VLVRKAVGRFQAKDQRPAEPDLHERKAVAAVAVAIIGGLVTYYATVRKASSDSADAMEGARAMLGAAEKQAAATLEAATAQAEGVREAGLRNAIETEAMKLRFRLAERHLDRFHERAGALVALLTELPRDANVAERFVQGMPHTPSVVLMEAELVVRPQDWERLAATLSTFTVATAGVGLVLYESPDPAQRTTAANMDLSKGCGTAIAALQHITAVVNVSSVVRAQGVIDEESQALLSSLYLRWEERKAALQMTNLWGGRLVGDG
jgi:hypothetical protein